MVPVKKKNEQIRIYVNFWDLNKACPKDEFPLPNVDHERFSFMDGYSGYNQILMNLADSLKNFQNTL